MCHSFLCCTYIVNLSIRNTSKEKLQEQIILLFLQSVSRFCYFAAFSTANVKTHINPVPMATAAGNAPPFPSRRLAIPPSVPMMARIAHTKTGTCRNSRMPLSSETTNASRPTNRERSCRGFFFSFICKIPD